MITELKLAVNYILSYLYNNLPRLRVDGFGQALEARLFEKLHNHWFPLQPCRDVQYRCLRVTGSYADPIMNDAAQASGLDIQEINSFLPSEELCIWIDPGEVTYRIGAKGITEVLGTLSSTCELQLSSSEGNAAWTWSSPNPMGEACVPCAMNPVTQPIPPNHLDFGVPQGVQSSSTSVSPMITPCSQVPNPFSPVMASAGHLTVPSANGVAGALPTGNNQVGMTLSSSMNIQKSFSTPSFTAAAFAQTKFGSTKLKSPSKSKNSSYQQQPHQTAHSFTNYQHSLSSGGAGVHRVSPVSVPFPHGVGHVPGQNSVCDLLSCPLPLIQSHPSHPNTWGCSLKGNYPMGKDLESKLDVANRSLPISPQPSVSISSTSSQQHATVVSIGHSNNKRCLLTETLPQNQSWCFSPQANGGEGPASANASPEWSMSNGTITNTCKHAISSPFWSFMGAKENAIFQS